LQLTDPEATVEADCGDKKGKGFIEESLETAQDDENELAEDREALDVELHDLPQENVPASPLPTQPSEDSALLYDDPSDDDDGEGEWITPSNVSLHKSRALGLTLSTAGNKTAKEDEAIAVGCMTTDFAMQNVLLQLGLSLVGVEGKRIEKVRTWVLRCHACFKICKDNTKKFCPACGNPTLLRTSVTVSAPGTSHKKNAPAMRVHLKKNFQFRTRGTIFAIPAPKPGSAKTGPGEGLILREDQAEYARAVKRAEAKRQRDERKMLVGGTSASGAGSWMDPDWVPEIIAASAGGKGRRTAHGDELPVIGYGRRNPNERRHRKK